NPGAQNELVRRPRLSRFEVPWQNLYRVRQVVNLLTCAVDARQVSNFHESAVDDVMESPRQLGLFGRGHRSALLNLDCWSGTAPVWPGATSGSTSIGGGSVLSTAVRYSVSLM